ncbi:putative polysaccharide biosynthesis protein [Edaphobacillus lindanitolerans]|uniref:Polysaccharide transporter, PST family n=1 Tax=Edaphobacillus lindanitolerans TaxID=550447 RepID=A0A1U7PTP6_9BACI|nr:polysaccharide biosynthesis protein [Edaphobacillus lindanitolerans]SIT93357.1 polysaccharide transporter, PST family [Edaphobacillus lindanitolerans]
MQQQWNMKTFMKGAAMLAAAGIIVKILSAVYRVPFQNLVGDKGFYIYQQVYPFIGIMTVWTSSGFAVAISKILADRDREEAGGVMRIALLYLAAVSGLSFLVLFAGAGTITGWMGDRALAPLLRTGSVVILLMPLLALLKGAFQAQGRMGPVAGAQIAEQAVRVLVILAGTWIAVSAGASLYRAGEAAMWGTVIGELAGVILILVLYRRWEGRPDLRSRVAVPFWPVARELTAVSLAASLSSLILLFFQLIDSFTMFNLMTASGSSREAAMEAKGVYDRGQPLVQMGILIASTLSLTMVPLVAAHIGKKSGRTAEPFVQLAWRAAFLFGWAASLGLILVMPYVNEMLFETRSGSGALMIFCLQIFWLSLILPLMAVLQGLGRVKIPALILFGGLVLKGLANMLLIPDMGITGAAIAGNAGFAAATAGLLVYFKRVWTVRLADGKFYRAVIGASVLMAAVLIPWMGLSDKWLFAGLPSRTGAMLTGLSAVAIGAPLFLAAIAKSRILSEKEWYLLPGGRRLAGMQLYLNKNRKSEGSE